MTPYNFRIIRSTILIENPLFFRIYEVRGGPMGADYTGSLGYTILGSLTGGYADVAPSSHIQKLLNFRG